MDLFDELNLRSASVEKNEVQTRRSSNEENVLMQTGTHSSSLEESEVPEHQDIPYPTIHNVMASCDLGVPVDLRKVAISARYAEYNPRKSNAVVLRVREPKMTGTVFRKGRMVVSGASSVESAETGARKLARIVQKAGHPTATFSDFHVDNIVAWADCGFPIRLEGLASDSAEFSSYEPEIFAGLIYRLNPFGGDKAVMTVFVTGKVMINQCRTEKQVVDAFRSVYPLFYKYQK